LSSLDAHEDRFLDSLIYDNFQLEDNYQLRLDMYYDCARYISAAHANVTADQPLLHLCLQASEYTRGSCEACHLAAWSSEAGSKQVQIQNYVGYLPLHYAAAHVPVEDNVDLLPLVLTLHPEGALMQNHQGKLPLDVAVDAGRGWNTGIRLLSQANPLALQTRAIPYELFPMILGELLQQSDKSIAFGLLRCNPGVFLAGTGEYYEPMQRGYGFCCGWRTR
jgi:hypothetical protein